MYVLLFPYYLYTSKDISMELFLTYSWRRESWVVELSYRLPFGNYSADFHYSVTYNLNIYPILHVNRLQRIPVSFLEP
jgi:hypothetical protein